MNLIAESARLLVQGILDEDNVAESVVERVICPPFVYLPFVYELCRETPLQVGAQDVHWEEKGAFTGEISPLMVREFAEYVIIGHSERRAFFSETDETVNRKIKAALVHGLKPIICVGE